MKLAGTMRPLAPSRGKMWLTLNSSALILLPRWASGDSAQVTISRWPAISLAGVKLPDELVSEAHPMLCGLPDPDSFHAGAGWGQLTDILVKTDSIRDRTDKYVRMR